MEPTDIEDLFRPVGHVAVARMFGGLGVRLDGLFFALVAGGEVFLKTSEETREAFRAAGARPFTFHNARGLQETSYLSLPEAAHEDEAELRRWAGLALEAARIAAAAKAAKGGKRKPKASSLNRPARTPPRRRG